MNADEYWANRYTDPDGVKHHSTQNYQISRDFLREVMGRPDFSSALRSGKIIEIGCGTGELSALISARFDTNLLYATDFSREAVAAAQYRHPSVNYWVFDILKDKPFGDFDLAIASNTLEHFQEPYLVVDNMLKMARKVILLIPYRQPIRDRYDDEGGAGHVYEFSKRTFKPYCVIDSFTFQTEGWQHSSDGETPLQLAVLLRARG